MLRITDIGTRFARPLVVEGQLEADAQKIPMSMSGLPVEPENKNLDKTSNMVTTKQIYQSYFAIIMDDPQQLWKIIATRA